MKPVLNELCSKGFISMVYLDDFLCIGNSYSTCRDNVKATVKLLKSLGFVINAKKSSLIPQTRCKYLGFILDSTRMGLELTVDKKVSLNILIENFLTAQRCKIRDFAKLIGSLISACSAVAYGWLYTKQLEKEKFFALCVNGDDYDQIMSIPKYLKSDLLWWKNVIPLAFNPIKQSRYKITIYTDASTTGWGAVCKGVKTHGLWSESERRIHINFLELLAMFLALKCFASNQRNCEILLRVDNTTAISYINKMGGIQYPKFNKLARQIWQWGEQRNIWLFASYIASKDNIEADKESRINNIDTEWELNEHAFNSIIKQFGVPKIDLFATRINNKCNTFCSWHRDPDAFAIDAFTISWSNWFFYAFPPFALILKTLRKIITDEAKGLVVVPNWPTQPWYPIFTSLCTEKPLLFDPSIGL